MKIVRCALFLLVLPCLRADVTWESLQLPTDAAPREVVRYLHTLRLLVNRLPERVEYRAPEWRPPAIDPVVRTKAGHAFDPVLPNFLELVLHECKTAESQWTQDRIEFYIQRPDGEKELAGFAEARGRHRTNFTRLALHHIASLDAVNGEQRKALFENLGPFPELMLGLVGRKWIGELDAFLSPKLMRQIDRVAGWRGSTLFWIEALLKIDTDRSREALEILLVEGQMPTRMAVYEALKDLTNSRIDLDAAMGKAWRAYVRESYVRERAVFAAVVASHGVTSALIELAEHVREHWPKVPLPQTSTALQGILAPRFTDAKQAADFVVKHRRTLGFDPVARKFSAGGAR